MTIFFKAIRVLKPNLKLFSLIITPNPNRLNTKSGWLIVIHTQRTLNLKSDQQLFTTSKKHNKVIQRHRISNLTNWKFKNIWSFLYSHLRNGAIYGSFVSVRVPVIPVQFQPHNFTAVITAYLGLFTVNSTKLHTLAVVRWVFSSARKW